MSWPFQGVTLEDIQKAQEVVGKTTAGSSATTTTATTSVPGSTSTTTVSSIPESTRSSRTYDTSTHRDTDSRTNISNSLDSAKLPSASDDTTVPVRRSRHLDDRNVCIPGWSWHSSYIIRNGHTPKKLSEQTDFLPI